LEGVRAVYEKAGAKAELAPFFNDLPARMAKAHLVIGRSGAGTVAELMVIGRPAILIPLPHALDDNQTPNADALADAGGGWRVKQSELTPQTLAVMLQKAFASPEDLAKRAAAAHAQAKPDAAQRLADIVDRLARAA
jgi:UDP-N-acetylglucosamine--N-acetylmuramyl-(pentapeptide) pyrophosphoryl-undecaprenol N-acetylglucosamine transferase